MLTFTCSTSKQSGVHSTKNTTRLSASTLTTGKISEESLISSHMTARIYARTGSPELSSPSTMKAAQTKLVANHVTDGRSKSIILFSIKQKHVKKSKLTSLQVAPPQTINLTIKNALEASNVPYITRLVRKESQKWLSSRETGPTSSMIKYSKCQ